MPALFPQEIIRRKRDGAVLANEEIAFLVRGIADGTLGDSQVAAFAMAVFFQGMTMDERVALTRAMTRSGRVLDWKGAKLTGPVVDKHSTGGVGDKVSLMLAPVVAACGGAVPMISGRGLGHTGGTLDKLAAIPGYDVAPDADKFRRVVQTVGCAIIGQTADLAPADRRLYAIRDITATVESIPLITASILSKKLAAGLDALVMDVKFGSGAFAAPFDEARELARSIVAVANGAGLKTTALLTDMNQVLGTTAGNAVEVREAVDYLTGARRDVRLDAVTRALSAEILILGGITRDREAAQRAVEKALISGAAAERFSMMVAEMGGPTDLIEHPARHLGQTPVVRPALPLRDGYVTAVNARAYGLVLMGLGGGRRRPEDHIDPAVGLVDVRGIGDSVGPGRPLAIVYARSEADAERAAEELRAATHIGDAPPAPAAAVRERIAP
jgi:thymidine phosphorylase